MKIGLQNFQGIGEYTEISIAPITLIYGANAVGKSTIVDALKFIKETLSGGNDWKAELERHARRNRKSRPLEKGFLGNPNDVVFVFHGYFSPDAVYDFVAEYSAMMVYSEYDRTGLLLNEFCPDDSGIPFEYRVFFADNESHQWHLRESVLFISKEPFFRYQSRDARFGTVDVAINSEHPMYMRIDKHFEDGLEAAIEVVSTKDHQQGLEIINMDGEFEIETARTIIHTDRGTKQELLQIIKNKNIHINWMEFKNLEGHDPFSSSPINWHDVTASGSDGYDQKTFFRLRSLIDFLITIPQRSAVNNLRLMSIPPIRPIPEASTPIKINLNGHRAKANSDWGTLASCFLEPRSLGESVSNSNLLSFVNEMLSSKHFLNTGYVISGKVKFLIDNETLQLFISIDEESRNELLRKAQAEVLLHLIYEPEDFFVEIADVGVGISQVIPVLVACWQAMYGPYRIIFIQQPELHLHPKLQAELADVFIKCINAKNFSSFFLLESHSEHLLLRMLRRIRETNSINLEQLNNISNDDTVINIHKKQERNLTSDQVSVIYASKDSSGLTQLKSLRLNDEGEFLDRWPEGFFTDRDRELFGDGEDPFS